MQANIAMLLNQASAKTKSPQRKINRYGKPNEGKTASKAITYPKMFFVIQSKAYSSKRSHNTAFRTYPAALVY